MATSDLTAARLRELLSYDPDTGVFTSRTKRHKWPAGRVVGAKEKTGYARLPVDGVYYRAHRLAWLYVYGAWPSLPIDHINGDRYDNRIGNLRQISVTENNENLRSAKHTNHSGLLGVSARPGGKFAATIKCVLGGQRLQLYLGAYTDAATAHAVYVDAKRKLHGGCTI